MWEEFKEFIMRGNVVDLAVGLVMGSAFTAIVNGLVEGIIMPFIAALSGNASVEDLIFTVNGTAIQYGVFLQAIIDFLLISVVLFLAIKGLNTLAAKYKKDEDEVEVPTAEEYLKEIRDLLADEKNPENDE